MNLIYCLGYMKKVDPTEKIQFTMEVATDTLECEVKACVRLFS